MASLTPEPREPIVLRLPYALTRKGIEDYVADKAADPPDRFTLQINFADLDKELRRRAFKLYERLEKAEPEIPAGVDDMDWRSCPEVDAYTEEPVTVIEAWEGLCADRDAKAAKAAEAYRINQAVLEGKRSSFRVEMARWIREQGSEQLRLGLERSYKIATAYVRERASLEFPGFVVDANGRARWQERANPSLKALKLESGALACQTKIGSSYKIRISWLVKEMSGADAKKREVIVVPEYLHLYTLLADVEAPKFDPDEIPF